MSGWYSPPSASASPSEWTLHITKICCATSLGPSTAPSRILTSLRGLRAALPNCRIILCNDLPPVGPDALTADARCTDDAISATDVATSSCGDVGAVGPATKSAVNHDLSMCPTSSHAMVNGSLPAMEPAAGSLPSAESSDSVVYTSRTGTSFHLNRKHAGKDSGKHAVQTTRGDAHKNGYEACRVCYGAVPPKSPLLLPTAPHTHVSTDIHTVMNPSDGNWSIGATVSASAASSSSSQPAGQMDPVRPRVFFFDLEADKKKKVHPTRQMAVRSLDGSVAWLRDVHGDFGQAWAEFESCIEPLPLSACMRIYLVAHNAKAFDCRILDAECAYWNITRRRHWVFVDSLPLIRTWMRSLRSDRKWKCDLVTLTKSLLRSHAQETNVSLIDYWTGKRGLRPAGAAEPHAHEADYDCLVLRSVFLLALGSFASHQLVKRTDGIALDALEQRITVALRTHCQATEDVSLESLVVWMI